MLSYLKAQCKEQKRNPVRFEGKCHDCGADTYVEIQVYEDGAEAVLPQGGGFWHNEHGDFIKCQECFEQDDVLRKFVPCEVFSRVTGFLRPVSFWNAGKQEEWKMRKLFSMEKAANNGGD
jgi:hypothetical protein